MRNMSIKIIPPERVEQEALVEWLSYHPLLKNFFHKTNNEGKRTALQGHRLVKQGLRTGVSDLFIYYPVAEYNGLWLEVKRNKNYTLSEKSTDTWKAQEKFIDCVKSVGFAAHFCYGWLDGKNHVENYLNGI